MTSLRKRLEAVEAQVEEANSQEWVIPIEVRVLAKAVERERSRRDGEPPPSYMWEEVQHLYREDLETATGYGVVAAYRDTPGWQGELGQSLLDAWQSESRRRVELAKSGVPLSAIYDDLKEGSGGDIYR